MNGIHLETLGGPLMVFRPLGRVAFLIHTEKKTSLKCISLYIFVLYTQHFTKICKFSMVKILQKLRKMGESEPPYRGRRGGGLAC